MAPPRSTAGRGATRWQPPRGVARWLGLEAATVAAVAARLAYVALFGGAKLSDDEISFWAVAGNIARGRGFSYQGRSTAWRPPLYTGLLAAARWVGASVRMVEVGQVAIGASLPVLFYLLTHRLTGSRRAALLAAWGGALYPPFVYFSGRILSENLAIPLYVLALWLTVEWLVRGGRGRAAWCGAAWGLAILGRPTALAVAVLCVVVGALVPLVRIRRRPGRGAGLAEAGLVAVVGIAVVLPWTIRNASAVGGPVPVVSNEGFTLWVPNRPDNHQLKNVLDTTRYPGIQDYAVYGRAFPGIEALAHARGFDFDHAGEAAQDAWFRKLAIHDIGAQPARFVARTIERAGLVLLPAPDNASQTAKTGTSAKAILWITSGPLMVLGVAGLLLRLARARRDLVEWFVVLAAVGSLLLVAVHVPYVRYRVDGLDPLLIPAAAWLLADAWDRSRRRSRPSPA
ncbi:MAG TPA: hypothetical protein VGI06_15565 [Acidimicrobiales bacterium]